MNELKPGDKVVMNDRYHVSEENRGKVNLVPALVSLIPSARKDEEIMRDWCEVCPRWSECNGVDDQCPWTGRE